MSQPIIDGLLHIEMKDVSPNEDSRVIIRNFKVKPILMYALTCALNDKDFVCPENSKIYFTPEILMDIGKLKKHLPKPTPKMDMSYNFVYNSQQAALSVIVLQKPYEEDSDGRKIIKRGRATEAEKAKWQSFDISATGVSIITGLVYKFLIHMVGPDGTCPFLTQFHSKHASLCIGATKNTVTVDLGSFLPFVAWLSVRTDACSFKDNDTWMCNAVTSFLLCEGYSYDIWAFNHSMFSDHNSNVSRDTCAGLINGLKIYVNKHYSFHPDDDETEVARVLMTYGLKYALSSVIAAPRLRDDISAAVYPSKFIVPTSIITVDVGKATTYAKTPSAKLNFSSDGFVHSGNGAGTTSLLANFLEQRTTFLHTSKIDVKMVLDANKAHNDKLHASLLSDAKEIKKKVTQKSTNGYSSKFANEINEEETEKVAIEKKIVFESSSEGSDVEQDQIDNKDVKKTKKTNESQKTKTNNQEPKPQRAEYVHQEATPQKPKSTKKSTKQNNFEDQ